MTGGAAAAVDVAEHRRHSHSGRSPGQGGREQSHGAVSCLMLICGPAASQVRLSRACGLVPGLSLRCSPFRGWLISDALGDCGEGRSGST